MNKNVGLLTWHYYENVGSNLQSYALFTYIKKLGYNVSFINYRKKELNDSFFKKILKDLIVLIDKINPKIIPSKYKFLSYRFQKDFFKSTKCFLKEKELYATNDMFDIFVCGSDQIWSPLVFDKVYFLNFVSNNKYKFSYAPSIGSNYIPNKMINEYKELLFNFNSISIREKKGQQLLNDIGIKSKVVLDPTFLLNKEEWKMIIDDSKNEDYIFCYFLGENEIHRKKVLEYAKRKKLKLYIYSNYKCDLNYCDKHIYKIGPKEFLNYIFNAKNIFTDSFHGTIFSIIFEKEFNSFYRFKENDLKNQNSRIIDLLEELDLSEFLVTDDGIINDKKIDYVKINNKLNSLIEKSKSYLNRELENGTNN